MTENITVHANTEPMSVSYCYSSIQHYMHIRATKQSASRTKLTCKYSHSTQLYATTFLMAIMDEKVQQTNDHINKVHK